MSLRDVRAFRPLGNFSLRGRRMGVRMAFWDVGLVLFVVGAELFGLLVFADERWM